MPFATNGIAPPAAWLFSVGADSIFTRRRLSDRLPPGGRGTAKRWKEPAGTKAEQKTLQRADMESAPTENGGRSKPLPYHGARCFDGG